MLARDSAFNLFTGDDTLPKLLKRNYEKWGDRKVAQRYKDFGIWRPYTWKDYYEEAKYISLGLVSLGLEPGDKVTIVAENAPQWFYTELGIQAAGAIPLGIYTDSIHSEIQYIVHHSDSKFAFADDQEQVDKFLDIKHELPNLRKVIYWDPKGMWQYDDPILMSFDQVLELGREYEKTHPGLFESNIDQGKGEDVAVFMYTSGTTGLPKGAMVSHRSLLYGIAGLMEYYPWREDDDLVSFIAPAWLTEQLFGIAGALMVGSVVNFPEEPETAQADIREIAPACLFASSRLWENMVRTVQAKMMDASLLKRFVYHLLFPVGYKVADLEFEGRKPSLFWRGLDKVADLALFRPLRDHLGLARARVCFTAGAMLAPDTFRYLRAMGVNLVNSYGITEAGSLACGKPGQIKAETVGPPVIGVDIRITDDGEILSRSSAIFAGYYKDPEKTAEVLGGGWFHSGDAGLITDDGHILYLDRVKDLGQLSDGTKYAPQYIETRLKFSPYIRDVMCLGDNRDYISVIIIIDYDNVGRWAESNHILYTTFTDLSQKREVYDLIQKDIERLNRFLPAESAIRKYVHLHKEFDPDEAELTRTRKLRRDFMEQRYAELIQAVYSGKSEVVVEAPITYRDGRTGTVTTTIEIRTVDVRRK
jgi:long-chain acyl-CoA synthetase